MKTYKTQLPFLKPFSKNSIHNGSQNRYTTCIRQMCLLKKCITVIFFIFNVSKNLINVVIIP